MLTICTEPYRLVFPSCLHYSLSFTFVLRNIWGKKEMRMDLSRPTQIKRRWCSIEMTPTMLVWRPWKQVVLGRKNISKCKAWPERFLASPAEVITGSSIPNRWLPSECWESGESPSGTVVDCAAGKKNPITGCQNWVHSYSLLPYFWSWEQVESPPLSLKGMLLVKWVSVFSGIKNNLRPSHEASGYHLWLTCFSFVVWIFVKKQPYFKITFP